MAWAIETQGLQKTYKGKIHALKGIDLQVQEGTAFGLLGPNGAGKSTLVKALLSIVHPTAGSARLQGIDSRDPEARRLVGYLPEGHRFPTYLTGSGVCRYFGRLSGLEPEELQSSIDRNLELVGMKEWANTKISKYSKGMLQRVGLAQAMLGNPKIIFLDEPTDGVDPVGRQQIRQVIQSLCEKGTTIFLNSHLLSEVEQVCNHIAIMHHGEILTQGSVNEITASIRKGGQALRVKFGVGHLGMEARKGLSTLTGPSGPVDIQYEDGAFRLTLRDRDQISAVVDILRQHRVAIYAIEPERVNLEEAFLHLIQEQSDQRVGAT